MATTDVSVVEREVRIDARPETIFQFFVDPAKMVRWKGRKAKLEARPGGVYWVDINGQNIARGEYVEVRPFTRVVFTWGWEGSANVPPGSSTVEITLIPDGNGTIVRLRHRDLPQGEREQHRKGWEHYLQRLAAAAAGRDAGPDPWADPANKM